MMIRLFVSAGLSIGLTAQASALSPQVPAHETAPPRIAEPTALFVAKPVPVAPHPPYCPVPLPYVGEATVVLEDTNILRLQEPDAKLPAIQTTPIQ